MLPEQPAAVTMDPRLESVARLLEEGGWAADLIDAEWRLVWVSPEIKALIGEEDEAKLGYGRYIFELLTLDSWMRSVSQESLMEMCRDEIPFLLYEFPGGKKRLLEIVGEEFAPLLDAVEPRKPPLLWASSLEFVQGDLPPTSINYVIARLYDEGELLGRVGLYGPGLPARVLNLVARGDYEMFDRMARLMQPGRHAAAVLFADLQDSGILSRRLPSSSYFKLVRAIVTAMDEVIARHCGIVGKHAGDGVTAFFLAGDLGSNSAAARAALESAREIKDVCSRALPTPEDEGGIEAADCLVNVGVHWGEGLYMGQLVTGGRLEVTALGDQVNECARIQESTRGGRLLASKALIEQLGSYDARALGIDPEAIVYDTVEELPAATDKAVRDAGSISVAAL